MLVVVACAACSSTHSPERIGPGLPHGGSITTVATTDAADAVLTVDDIDGTRLWPSLDGYHPPVPVAVAGSEQITLAHAGDDFAAAFLDDAGDVLVLRLGRDGAVHARAQIPGEVAAEQIVAVEDGVLVMRADQSIERYDADAVLRARTVARSGEQITAIAARRGGAVALLGDNVGGEMLARTISLDDGLAWGRTTELPAGVTARTVALSPSHANIAVATRMVVEVIDLATGDAIGDDVPLTSDHFELGFTDDDHLAVLTSDIQWWPRPHRTQSSLGISGGAVGDGLAIGGFGATLAVTTGKKVYYLGWDRSAVGELGIVGSQVALVDHHGAAWLDERLALTSEREVGGLDDVLWLDARHVVRYGGTKTYVLDVDRPDSPMLVAESRAHHAFYNPVLHVLALHLDDGVVSRYALDLDHLTARKLTPLQVSPAFSSPGVIELLDPARADGVIAMTHWSPPTRVVIYRDDQLPRKLELAEVLAVDSTGTIYFREVEHGRIFKRRDRSEAELVDISAKALVPSHDAAHLVALGEREVTLYGAKGARRWSHELPAPMHAVFSADDESVIVQTAGGLVAFDVATGSVIADACAFDFGFHDHPPVTNPLHADPVCGTFDGP